MRSGLCPPRLRIYLFLFNLLRARGVHARLYRDEYHGELERDLCFAIRLTDPDEQQ